MFTDGPATPVRLEVLLDVLAAFQSGLRREEIYDLIQPLPLSDGGQLAAKDTLRAGKELGLVEEKKSVIALSKDYEKKKSAKENILRAADEIVLSSLKVEFHLALFYSYFLGLNKAVYRRSGFSRDDWANSFNKDVFNNKPQSNPFNATKHTGLDRWLCYLGMGWYDSSEQFQANPYERLLRALPVIFGGKLKLQGDQFMIQLSQVCPELDGGKIFLKANKYRNYKHEDKQCTLGFSHALVDLHEDKIIRLHCPVDSLGWNIALAQPSRDDTIKADRITLIEYQGS